MRPRPYAFSARPASNPSPPMLLSGGSLQPPHCGAGLAATRTLHSTSAHSRIFNMADDQLPAFVFIASAACAADAFRTFRRLLRPLRGFCIAPGVSTAELPQLALQVTPPLISRSLCLSHAGDETSRVNRTLHRPDMPKDKCRNLVANLQSRDSRRAAILRCPSAFCLPA